MASKNKNNYAFIDSQNLNLAIRAQGWILDFARFRVYLKEKYGVAKAYLFVGFVKENQKLYDFLRQAGYICIFKPTVGYKDGITKGNCDAELVLHTMIELDNFEKAIIVSGDGDFYCLAEYLIKQDKLDKILIPNRNRYSGLLKGFSTKDRNFLDYMNDLRGGLSYENEKGSQQDKT